MGRVLKSGVDQREPLSRNTTMIAISYTKCDRSELSRDPRTADRTPYLIEEITDDFAT
ncbi:hypothetical protein ACGFQG_07500 [Nocardia fluminea]|uniref:hypothetical protein n=1 Tax=Nocardia fluminea TaxID=134984 RepID=UPI0014755AD9|nr:hypothetical protein [Nocardia fluminea]